MITKNKKIFILFCLPTLIYLPSLFFGFSYFDDNVLILDNLGFLKNLNNFFQAFKEEVFHIPRFSAAYYRPILTLSFMIDTQFSGSSPFFYHLSNVIIHSINSILVFIFLKKLKVDKKLAFILSIFFSIHPVLTQAVAWIPGRNDSLLTLFTLSSFIFFINYLDYKKTVYFVMFSFFSFLSLFTKETAILNPIFIILYLIFFQKKKIKSLIEIIIVWWFIFLFWFILRQKALNNILYLSLYEILKSLINNKAAFFLYWGKIFFPVNLSTLPTLKDSSLIWGIFATLIFLLLIFFLKVKRRLIFLFGFLWFVGFLFPSFIRPNSEIAPFFLEHRLYLPFVGFLLMIASIDEINNFLSKKISFFFIYPLIFIFSLITFIHLFTFRDRLVFWENAAKTSPHSPLAQRNYGAMFYFEKKYDQAMKHYQRSLKLNPNEPMVHNNIGVIYLEKGKLKEAIEEFEREIKINPYYDNALANLGLAYYQLNDKDKARQYWEKTLSINPNYYQAYKYLAVYYQEKNDFQKANYYLNLFQLKSGL